MNDKEKLDLINFHVKNLIKKSIFYIFNIVTFTSFFYSFIIPFLIGIKITIISVIVVSVLLAIYSIFVEFLRYFLFKTQGDDLIKASNDFFEFIDKIEKDPK